MSRGKIKFFNGDKGFGFIAGDDGKEYFLHIRNVQGGVTPSKDESVTFKVRAGQKGPEAYDAQIGSHKPAGGNAATPNTLPRGGGSSSQESAGSFPFGFVRRDKFEPTPPQALHHRLESDRYDIAFEVIWTTETPTALTPCEDTTKPSSAIGRDGENIGYNKRWLMIDGCPAISPFTVKGAIAGGIANLLGGCYRVTDLEEGHNSSLNTGTYPYTGAWKRYRVSMNGKSLPGIIREINPETGEVRVQPVIEYYWDQQETAGLDLQPGQSCHAVWQMDRRRNIIQRLSASGQAGQSQGPVIYYGPYRFGMNLQLLPGDMNKRHFHRFYSVKGGELAGKIPKLALAPEKNLLKKVYGGVYCKDDPNELKVERMRSHLGKPWYDDPASLKPGDWCYYTAFKDQQGKERIVAIGKNFQFKALFRHADTIPAGNKTCTDLNQLCPRCNLFGLADKNGNDYKKAVGYAGRFRAATLISRQSLKEKTIAGSIPSKETLSMQKVEFSAWHNAEGRELIRQCALPIIGSQKPSKRDLNGYFVEATGEVKGAKRYHHAELDYERSLPDLINHTDRKSKTEEGLDYGHQMRPIAPVMREGIDFFGTLCGENCSVNEIAALLFLLDYRTADHAFKLGLGKSAGLGSVSSQITMLWMRDPASYSWKSVEVPTSEGRKDLFDAIRGLLPEAVEDLKKLINTAETLKKAHGLKEKRQRLTFAKAGFRYWSDAQIETV